MFSEGRNVEEVSNMDSFCEERIVKEETDCEDSKLQLKTKCLDEEMKESTKGPLRMVPKERLLSADGLRAHRTGRFLDMNLKRKYTIRAELEEMVDEERAVKSECSDFNPFVKEEYKSKPNELAKVTFKEVVRLPEVTGQDGYTRETIKTVTMTEEKFNEFLKHKAQGESRKEAKKGRL